MTVPMQVSSPDKSTPLASVPRPPMASAPLQSPVVSANTVLLAPSMEIVMQPIGRSGVPQVQSASLMRSANALQSTRPLPSLGLGNRGANTKSLFASTQARGLRKSGVGDELGTSEGAWVGTADGGIVGVALGVVDGTAVGSLVVTGLVGVSLGVSDGAIDGVVLGVPVGVGVGMAVGVAVGLAVGGFVFSLQSVKLSLAHSITARVRGCATSALQVAKLFGTEMCPNASQASAGSVNRVSPSSMTCAIRIVSCSTCTTSAQTLDGPIFRWVTHCGSFMVQRLQTWSTRSCEHCSKCSPGC